MPPPSLVKGDAISRAQSPSIPTEKTTLRPLHAKTGLKKEILKKLAQMSRPSEEYLKIIQIF